MRKITFLVVFCLMALPLWADYGMSNVVTKTIDSSKLPEQPLLSNEKIPLAPQSIQSPESALIRNPLQESLQTKKAQFYPYTIHVSSHENMKDAVAVYKRKYQKLESVFVTKIDLGDTGIWYRIDLGTFPTISEANSKMKDLQARGIIDKEAFIGSSVPFTIELGVYSEKSEAQRVADELKSKSIIPYIIKGPGSSYRLLCGAFPNDKSAYPALEDINVTGMQSKITKR